MIKTILTDKTFLHEISAKVIDLRASSNQIAVKDLLDTANSIADRCVGLAAPQIGWLKRIIAVKINKEFVIMINPVILKKYSLLKFGNEGCLSVPRTIENNVRIKRWYKIKVQYTDVNGNEVFARFKSFDARVIQHEVDHLDGILIS